MIKCLGSPIAFARRVLGRKSLTKDRLTDNEAHNSSLARQTDADYFLVVSSGPKRWMPSPSPQGQTEYPSCIFAPDGSVYKDSPRLLSTPGYVTFSQWGCEYCIAQGIRENSEHEVVNGTFSVLLELKHVKLKKLGIRSMGLHAAYGDEDLLCYGQSANPHTCVVCTKKKVRKMRKKLRVKTVGIPEHMAGNSEGGDSDVENIFESAEWEKKSLERHSYSHKVEEPLQWHNI